MNKNTIKNNLLLGGGSNTGFKTIKTLAGAAEGVGLNLDEASATYTDEIRQLVNQVKLTPLWVCGIVAAEGSFGISFGKDFRFVLFFTVSLGRANIHLLWAIKEFFGGVGTIRLCSNNMANYTVSNVNDILRVIIPFFDKYGVLGSKSHDYKDFREATFILSQKYQLTVLGYSRLCVLYSGINTGRDYVLVEPIMQADKVVEYPSYDSPLLSKVERSELDRPVKNVVVKRKTTIKLTKEMKKFVSEVELHPDWIAAFVAGDGSFYLGIDKSSGPRPRVKPNFQVALVYTNQQLLWALKRHFGEIGSVCGAGNSMARFIVSGIKDASKVIVPFFKAHPVLGNKALDFRDYAEAVSLMTTKAHLTPEGHNRCVALKNGMNTGRDLTLPENRVMIIQDKD